MVVLTSAGAPQRIYTVTAAEDGKSGAVHWSVTAQSPLAAVEAVLTQIDSAVSEQSPRQQLREMAQDLLELAGVSEMPPDVFSTDARIARAAAALGMSISQAWMWVQRL